MDITQRLRRKAHFPGTKIRSLRKRNNLTLEDLSIRRIQVDSAAAATLFRSRRALNSKVWGEY